MISSLEKGRAYTFVREANMGRGRHFNAGDVVVAKETPRPGEGGQVAFWKDGRVRVVAIEAVALMVMNPSVEPVDEDLLALEDGQRLTDLQPA